jgi:hypothetical protein
MAELTTLARPYAKRKAKKQNEVGYKDSEKNDHGYKNWIKEKDYL